MIGNMFAFEIGEKVRKISGYVFRGIVVARYSVDRGIRYDVQINAEEAVKYVEYLSDKYKMNEDDVYDLIGWVKNCDGMIHIFAENQIEKDV